MTLLQAFGQQSTYNSSSNQPSYGRPDAGPGIDQSLSSHIPGGQGVSTASEQVGAKNAVCIRFELVAVTHTSWLQGFGRVGGPGTGQTGIDQSLSGHVPHGQNVGTASGQVMLEHGAVMCNPLCYTQTFNACVSFLCLL